MKKRLFNIPEDRDELLRQRASEDNVSVSEVIRRSVDALLFSGQIACQAESAIFTSGMLFVVRR